MRRNMGRKIRSWKNQRKRPKWKPNLPTIHEVLTHEDIDETAVSESSQSEPMSTPQNETGDAPDERPELHLLLTECPAGLEFLLEENKIYAKKLRSASPSRPCWKCENQYQVLGSTGQALYRGQVHSWVYEEKWLSSRLSFKMDVHNAKPGRSRPTAAHDQERTNADVRSGVGQSKFALQSDSLGKFFELSGAVRTSLRWSPCSAKMELRICTASGETIGEVRQLDSWSKTLLIVTDAAGREMLQMFGPTRVWETKRKNLLTLEKDGSQIGAISKSLVEQEPEMPKQLDCLEVSFPADLDVRIKALVLGTAFLMQWIASRGTKIFCKA